MTLWILLAYVVVAVVLALKWAPRDRGEAPACTWWLATILCAGFWPVWIAAAWIEWGKALRRARHARRAARELYEEIRASGKFPSE